jgi:hypothetical protein
VLARPRSQACSSCSLPNVIWSTTEGEVISGLSEIHGSNANGPTVSARYFGGGGGVGDGLPKRM